jgi:hypothetical protein
MPGRDPDFLGIGAARSASTWLHQRLSLHPDICLPKRKELNFFDIPESEGVHCYGPDLKGPLAMAMRPDDPAHWRWYRGHFARCGARLAGEFTPDYSLLDLERIALVKDCLPDLKLIFAVRNPVARAWSSVRKELWWRFRMYPRDLPDPEVLKRMAMRPGVLARGDYLTTIGRWETYYPGRILYLVYDDLLESPQSMLHRVCDFLGVSRAPLDAAGGHGSRVNDVPEDDIPAEVRGLLERHYAPQLPLLGERLGRSFAHWIPGDAGRAGGGPRSMGGVAARPAAPARPRPPPRRPSGGGGGGRPRVPTRVGTVTVRSNRGSI